MVVSAAFKPFDVFDLRTNVNGDFNPSGTFLEGTGFYTLDSGVTWKAFGTGTALTGATVPFSLGYRAGAITSLANLYSASPTGTIPSLPNTLTSIEAMFSSSSVSGSFPTLPTSLTNGRTAFRETALSGPIPAFPPGLINGGEMYEGCGNARGPIPAFPSTLTNVAYMFSDSGVNGTIPALPNTLTSIEAMFSVSSVSGPFPTLPTSLTNGRSAFRATALSGPIPVLPISLANGSWMFRECSQATGAFPVPPAALTNASGMFWECINATYTAGTFANTTCTDWTNAFFGCSLTSAMVNAMLADFRAAHTAGRINGANLRLGINGGTNGAPTGQGVTDRTFLVGLGAVITTN